MITANATYAAKVSGGSIKITHEELDLEIHQMIVFLMHKPEAAYLLPAYRELRQQLDERDEAQKTHNGSDI